MADTALSVTEPGETIGGAATAAAINSITLTQSGSRQSAIVIFVCDQDWIYSSQALMTNTILIKAGTPFKVFVTSTRQFFFTRSTVSGTLNGMVAA